MLLPLCSRKASGNLWPFCGCQALKYIHSGSVMALTGMQPRAVKFIKHINMILDDRRFCKVLHRDLKPANVLLNSFGTEVASTN